GEAAAPAALLSPPEARLLRCLLTSASTDWLREEGHMRSVLVDAINEKLYDAFGDTVLDDEGRPVADYVADLKEMLAR
ncbi:tellurite resistance TerB C-terminal domain-containing protein, partial [Desulfovibrio sp.]|uniref:tellurite resistance TerB C-terminal domain-containing protein n=1 Tax=Desulfovibrio sp. TaxID=885 RepID=UPI0023D376B4